jgi:hypothetical protein
MIIGEKDINGKSNLGFGPLGWLLCETRDGYLQIKIRIRVI